MIKIFDSNKTLLADKNPLYAKKGFLFGLSPDFVDITVDQFHN